MALCVVEVLVTRKCDEVIRGKWCLGLVQHNGEFALIRSDDCGIGLVCVETVAWSIFKCGSASFAAINGRTWSVASNRATLNWCCCRGVHSGVACTG